MPIPSAFRKLCFYFHQDVGLDASTPADWIAFARRHLDSDERIVVSQFVDQLLSDKKSGTELQRIWFSTDAEIAFPDDAQLREFLKLIRSMME